MIDKRYNIRRADDGGFHIYTNAISSVCYCKNRGMAKRICDILNFTPTKGELKDLYVVAAAVMEKEFQGSTTDVAHAIVNAVLAHQRHVSVLELKRAMVALKKWASDNDKSVDSSAMFKLANVIGGFNVAEDKISATISY